MLFRPSPLGAAVPRLARLIAVFLPCLAVLVLPAFARADQKIEFLRLYPAPGGDADLLLERICESVPYGEIDDPDGQLNHGYYRVLTTGRQRIWKETQSGRRFRSREVAFGFLGSEYLEANRQSGRCGQPVRSARESDELHLTSEYLPRAIKRVRVTLRYQPTKGVSRTVSKLMTIQRSYRPRVCVLTMGAPASRQGYGGGLPPRRGAGSDPYDEQARRGQLTFHWSFGGRDYGTGEQLSAYLPFAGIAGQLTAMDPAGSSTSWPLQLRPARDCEPSLGCVDDQR
jgi:hypothetical protein